MHCINGAYLKEEIIKAKDGSISYTFSLVYSNKARQYKLDNKLDYDAWISSLKSILEEDNILSKYTFGDIIGQGIFGTVREGTHKLTSKKVAIKIINKVDIVYKDLELIRNEIEVLKICQHPNIVKLYDIMENSRSIYIIMEHCEGSDLFNYFENKNFDLEESQVCEIIHKLAMGVYYLHSYGILHRDLKPENIMIFKNGKNSEIRLVDFGLSKIMGPKEHCNDPYGTVVNLKYLIFSHLQHLNC